MKKICFYVIVLLGLTGIGCKKSAPAKPGWTAGSDVYIVGSDDTGHVVYWKNGLKTVVADAGLGYGITVVGSDVYVGGVVFTGGGQYDRAAYWKNGVETDLGPATGTSWAYQPVVQGGDVYVPGYVFGPTPQVYPVYWKDGQQVIVDPTRRGTAAGMAVSDTAMYVIGTTYDGQFDTSLLWRNGVRTDLYGIDAGGLSQVFFSGGDLYIVGFNGYFVYNKQYVQLPNANGTSGMFISGQDIYVSGWTVDSSYVAHPAYWKNGVQVSLPAYKSATFTSTTGIAVAGSDVYVIGATYVNFHNAAVYWKNGVEDSLSGNGEANGIVLGN